MFTMKKLESENNNMCLYSDFQNTVKKSFKIKTVQTVKIKSTQHKLEWTQ